METPLSNFGLLVELTRQLGGFVRVEHVLPDEDDPHANTCAVKLGLRGHSARLRRGSDVDECANHILEELADDTAVLVDVLGGDLHDDLSPIGNAMVPGDKGET